MSESEGDTVEDAEIQIRDIDIDAPEQKGSCAFIPFQDNTHRKAVFVISTLVIAVLICGAALLLISTIVTREFEDQTEETYDDPDRDITVSRGGIAGDNQLCAEIGKEILENLRGNAIDAIIASTLCVGVTQPFSSGIGGGCVINMFMKDEGKSLILDAREVAPSLAHRDMFVGREINSTTGPLAVGVPGELKGLYTIWERFGSLDWKVLVEPSIDLAMESTITELDILELESVGLDVISQWKGLKDIYIREGEFVKVGDIISRPKLAATLQLIAENGADIYYEGSLGDDMANELEEVGGIITRDDIRNYTAVWRDALVVPYQYYTLNVAPPPFGGAVMGMAMNILEHDKLKMDHPESEHLIIESWKWAYDDRLALGDPAFSPTENVTRTMLSKDHALFLRSKIHSNQTFPKEYYSDLVTISGAVKQLEDHGTMHINAVDIYGNMVALTSTVNDSWGSKYVGDLTGIVYNNEMDDFITANLTSYADVSPLDSNYIAPGKRPLSSMNPTIVQDADKNPIMALGASGGTKIITSTMQVLLSVLSWNLTAGEAISRPRIHNQLIPEETLAEELFNSQILNSLTNMGHKVATKHTLACTSVIYKENDEYHLSSDWRKFGVPAGY